MFKLINLYASITSYFGVIPVEWCSKTRTAIPSQKAWRKSLYMTISIVIWDLFAIIQMARFYVTGDSEKFNVVLAYGLGGFVSLVPFSLFTFRTAEGLALINNVFFYLKHMNRNKLI